MRVQFTTKIFQVFMDFDPDQSAFTEYVPWDKWNDLLRDLKVFVPGFVRMGELSPAGSYAVYVDEYLIAPLSHSQVEGLIQQQFGKFVVPASLSDLR